MAVLTAGMFVLDAFKRNDLILPRTQFAGIDFTGLSRSEARIFLEENLKNFLTKPMQIGARGAVQSITMQEINVGINTDIIFNQLPFAADFSNAEIIFWTIAGKRVEPKAKISKAELLRAIEEKFPDIPRAKNAQFGLTANKISIIPEKEGIVPNIDMLTRQLQKNIAFLEVRPLFVDFNQSTPTVLASDLEQFNAQILKEFPGKLNFVYGKEKWAIDFGKHPEQIFFDKKNYNLADGQLPFTMTWNPVSFSKFVDENKLTKLEQLPENIKIWRDIDDKVQFEGHGADGRAIDREHFLALVNNAIANKKTEIEIPLDIVLPKLDIDEKLQTLGVREIVSVGYTRFVGSPPNRIHNIDIGVARFNGLLIAPGETFSFNDNLGVVDASTGYKKELVIKPEGTIPEFGGGLCQVSSTMYRAALFAGLPIAERSPHTYAVTYYSQVLGHGLDATIYPPSKDLRFVNDTPGYILIHSYVDGPAAYFKFFGTNDGRKIEMDGPYISNRINPPSEPMLVPDSKLAPGEKKQVEKPHGGFDALWFRRIIKNETTTEEKIFTRYKAVPAKYLIGGQITAEGENKGLAETVNPLE